MVSLGGIKSWSEGVRDKMRREWGILVWSEFWKERVSLNAWGAGEGSCSGELKWSGVAGGNWIGRGTWRGELKGDLREGDRRETGGAGELGRGASGLPGNRIWKGYLERRTEL